MTVNKYLDKLLQGQSLDAVTPTGLAQCIVSGLKERGDRRIRDGGPVRSLARTLERWVAALFKPSPDRDPLPECPRALRAEAERLQIAHRYTHERWQQGIDERCDLRERLDRMRDDRDVRATLLAEAEELCILLSDYLTVVEVDRRPEALMTSRARELRASLDRAGRDARVRAMRTRRRPGG